MDKKKKIILIIAIISLSILIIIGATAAFFGWRATKEATVDVTIASGTGNCSLKRDNNIFIEPSSTREGGRIIELTASQNMDNKASITWNMNIKSIEGLPDSSFKYEMINTSTGVSYGYGTFENITKGSTITFSNTEEALGFNLEYEFTLYLWIEGNVDYNQISMADQTLDFDISCDIIGTETGTINIPSNMGGATAAEYITDLYYNSNPELIAQPTSGTEYYYADSVNLMNDRLGNIDGNIRYYGKDPNNYIYFNCDDYTNQSETTCEKWKIIGVFEGKLKITKADSLGNYSWNYTSTGEGNANWNSSTLMTVLNNGYYNNSDNVTYYNNSSNAKTINYATDGLGIKNEKTRNMISDSTWYIGSFSTGVYPNAIYGYEQGFERCTTCTGEAIWNGKIAIPSASDYGFASDLRVCDKNMNKYNDENCIKTNWLYKGVKTWLLTTHNEYPNYAWCIDATGSINNDERVQYSYAVHPTLYLNADLEFNEIGDGTATNPYQIYTIIE